MLSVYSVPSPLVDIVESRKVRNSGFWFLGVCIKDAERKTSREVNGGFRLEGWRQLPDMAHFLLFQSLHGHCFMPLPLPAPTHLTSEFAGLAYSSCEGGHGRFLSFNVILLISTFSSIGVVFYVLRMSILGDSKVFPERKGGLLPN